MPDKNYIVGNGKFYLKELDTEDRYVHFEIVYNIGDASFYTRDIACQMAKKNNLSVYEINTTLVK